jgi:hypothetical protein
MNASKTSFTADEIAKAAGCSARTIYRRRSNIPQTVPKAIGRPRSITPGRLDTLCEHLQERPGMYFDEMVFFLWDNFNRASNNLQRSTSSDIKVITKLDLAHQPPLCLRLHK